jgi:hypothetical protein
VRRKVLWVVGIAALLGLAAWLFGLGEETTPAQPPVAFPERLRPEEQKRAEARRSLPAPKPQQAQQPAARPRPRDPLLAALRPASSAVVLEANALRNSPAGELLLKCFAADDERVFDRMREESGIDPLKDLDRIAIEPNGVVVTGQFGDAKWSSMFNDPGQSYGDEGVLYQVPGSDGGAMNAARWGNQLLAFGEAGSAQQLIDQVEGRGSAAAPPIGEAQTYGDAYGVIGGDWLSSLLQSALGSGAPGTEARILQAANSVELHVDATSDVNLTATFNGPDPSAVDDLGRALGGALSLWRLSAQAQGDSKLGSLLDQASIVPGSGSFRLELSVPLDLLKDQLKDCGKRHVTSLDGG